MVAKRFAFTLCCVLFFVFTHTVYSETWLDKAKNKYDDLRGAKKTDVETSSETKEKASIARAEIPNDLPDDWRLELFEESIFGSELVLARVGEAGKPKVFLVHGLGQLGMRDWLTVVPKLKADYEVFVIDLPGFASSGKPKGKYSPSNYAGVLNEVKAYYAPSEQISMIGHSMGAAVTLRYSHLYPNSLKRAVLVDAAGILQRTAFMKHSVQISNAEKSSAHVSKLVLSKTQGLSNNLIELINLWPDPSRLIKSEGAWSKTFSGKSNANAAFALIEEDFSEAIYNNKVAITLIWGELDTVAPLRTGEVLSHALGGAKLSVIAGAKHVPMKTHSDLFNDYLKHHLDQTYSEPEQKLQEGENINCGGISGRIYTGDYKKVHISDCKAITLRDMTAEQLIIKDSQVDIEDVSLTSKGTAFSCQDSVVLATNLSIKGDVAMLLDDCRLDSAGMYLEAYATALNVLNQSRLVISIARVSSAKYKGFAHGLYVLEQQSLDEYLQ
ncbi:alpha/beta fold hydrolase [Agaribacterium sp. ZY112]|uniref:alpha/beta fold hydrolase n=1 Tax=Agaribacterium sp. ZY112 TaxID=3233574 RepID=UPI003525D34C